MPTRRRTVTRRRNPATLVTALENAHALLAEANKLAWAAAEEAEKAVAALGREPLHSTVKRSQDFIVHAAFNDAYAVYEAANRAGTYARDGAAAAKTAKRSLVAAHEAAGLE